MAALSMWSAAVCGTVKVSSRGNARPVLLWSALVAGTGRGKGTALRAAHKEEAQEVRDPAIVLHCHVTPSDWTKYVGESEAAGGSYNRILPFLLGSVPMLDDDRVSLPKVDVRNCRTRTGGRPHGPQ